MTYKNSNLARWLMCLLLIAASFSGQAQSVATSAVDSLELQKVAPPRISYGLTAGAFGGTLGYGSYLEPRINYQVSPRFQVFSSLMAVQHWGSRTFNTTYKGEGLSNQFSTNPNRQFLLHVGGAYAMTDKLTLSGSVWKDLGPNATPFRTLSSPYGLYRSPQQGYNFQAHYKISDNVTISGGVRSGNGYSQGLYGDPMGGFGSPWGY